MNKEPKMTFRDKMVFVELAVIGAFMIAWILILTP